MRHRRQVRRFGANGSHHQAIMRNLIISLIMEEKVVTTVAKAKETSRLMDRMITLARKGEIAAQRRIWSRIHHKRAMKRLIHDVLPRFQEQSEGGYTRVIRTGQFRNGDGAELALVCFVGSEMIRVEKRQKRLEEKAKRA